MYEIDREVGLILLLFFFSSDNAPERQIQVRYDVMEVPITLPSQKPAADKPNPKQGIGKAVSDANILFSHEPIQILLIIILQNPVSSHLSLLYR